MSCHRRILLFIFLHARTFILLANRLLTSFQFSLPVLSYSELSDDKRKKECAAICSSIMETRKSDNAGMCLPSGCAGRGNDGEYIHTIVIYINVHQSFSTIICLLSHIHTLALWKWQKKYSGSCRKKVFFSRKFPDLNECHTHESKKGEKFCFVFGEVRILWNRS